MLMIVSFLFCYLSTCTKELHHTMSMARMSGLVGSVLVVRVLAFYSDDPSLNLSIFLRNDCLKRTKRKKAENDGKNRFQDLKCRLKRLLAKQPLPCGVFVHPFVKYV